MKNKRASTVKKIVKEKIDIIRTKSINEKLKIEKNK